MSDSNWLWCLACNGSGALRARCGATCGLCLGRGCAMRCTTCNGGGQVAVRVTTRQKTKRTRKEQLKLAGIK
jgi:hypothetical protein